MRLIARTLAAIAFAAALFSVDSTPVAVATIQAVTLTPTTSPTSGQPGVQPIALTGSNFPSGTINPAAVVIALVPATPGSGPSGSTQAGGVTTIVGSTRRVTFLIPANVVVATPTSYLVTLSGTTTTGIPFQSQNASLLIVNPPAILLNVTPDNATQGVAVGVTLNTQYTNFVQGSTQASFGPGIGVGAGALGAFGPVTVVSPTQAIAQVTVDPSTSLGFRTVQVRTGVQVASRTDGFSVLGPTVLDLKPAQLTVAAAGTASLTVTLQNPSTTVDMHVGVTSGDATVVLVPSEVVVPAGATTAMLSLVGGVPGGPVPITVTLNSTSATAEVTVRSRPLAPTIAEPLVEGAIVVGGSGVANALVDVFVDGIATGVGTVGSDGQFGVAVATLRAGQVVTATQTSGGLTGLPSAPVTVRARPPAPTVSSPLVAGSTQVPGTGSPLATITIFVDGALVATGFAAVDGTFTIAVPVLVAGQHITATQTIAGVTSIPSAAVTVVAAPAPPSITSPLIAGATSVTGGGSPGSTVEAFVDNSSAGTAIVNGSGTWTLALGSSLVVGQHVKARQTVGGIPSAFSSDVVVVARPPSPVINTPLVDGSTSVGGTGVAGGSVAVFINGAAAGSTAVSGNGTWSLALVGGPLVVGQVVVATQTVGGIESNPSPPTTVVARPPAPVVNAPLVAGGTSVSGAGIGEATVNLFVGGSAAGTATVNPAGTWVVVLATPLVVGQQVTANQIVAGVTSGLSPPVTVVAQPPAPSISGPLFAGGMTISGTGVAGASLEVFANGASLDTTAVGGGGTWSLPLATALIAGQVITAQQIVGGIPSALSAPVTVQAALTQIIITPAPTAAITKGQTIQFSARGTFSDGSSQDPLPGVMWSSDNTGVAQIDSTGLAAGAGAGVANIRATKTGVSSAATALSVKPLPPTISVRIATVLDGRRPPVNHGSRWTASSLPHRA